MGKLVLYWLAALVVGNMMVAIPMGISFTGYMFTVESGKFSAEVFGDALLTGFILYLLVVWMVQESCRNKIGTGWRVIVFIVSPTVIMYFYAEWSLVACMAALAAIASLAAYQMLVTVFARHRRKSS